MGYAERVDKCNSNTKNTSKTDSYKSGNSSSGSRSSGNDNKDAYKYNNMVKNDRDKFNNLHHC